MSGLNERSPVPHHAVQGEPRKSAISLAPRSAYAAVVLEVEARKKSAPDQWERIRYSIDRTLGNGSYGQVVLATLHNNEKVAIKTSMIPLSSTSQEVNILRNIEHCNAISLKYFFYSEGGRNDVWVSLITDFLPCTLDDVFQHAVMTDTEIKLYSYQLCRVLAYLRKLNICHLDLKPNNILVDPHTGVLKVCDFGSSRVLSSGLPNIAYECTRFYRAPELLFGNMNYSCAVDVWSAGCILAEMFLLRPLFIGWSGQAQLVAIFRILGSPTAQDLRHIHPMYAGLRFPRIPRQPWSRVLGRNTPPAAVHLIDSMLKLRPSERLNMLLACADPFYDELRQPGARLRHGADLPPLFNFTLQELEGCSSSLVEKLVPLHHRRPAMPQP